MRIDKLHKFRDGTLTDVRTALDDYLKWIRMKYLPQSIWRKSDKDRATAMIQTIDKRLKTRRIMRSLERFVGGRLYEEDFRMLQRSILTDLQVTLTKTGQMTKPYSSHHFITNCFNAENLKMKVKFDQFIHSKVLKPSNYNSYDLETRRDFKEYTQMEPQTFKDAIIPNMDSIEQCIVERASHEQELQNGLKRLNERKLQIQKCKVQKVKASNASSGDKDCSRIVSDKENDQVSENQSNTSGDESSRSRNECNDKSTSMDDTDIRPSYDTESMIEVPYITEYNVFVVDTQHSEQSECIINTCVVEKVDSNVIPDSPDMCDNDIQIEQNVEDKRVVLANLIANLKLDID
nr:hypothetical protein [Tanacetum cinerariifolium]